MLSVLHHEPDADAVRLRSIQDIELAEVPHSKSSLYCRTVVYCFCFPPYHAADICGVLRIRYVGCTHTIVRFQTRIRRNDETENCGGFVFVLDGFPQRDFELWVFVCPTNVTLFCVFYFVSILFPFYGYHAVGYHAPFLLPRAITPVYVSRLSRNSIYLFLGYHT